MPKGANAITIATNLNITSESASQNWSITCFGRIGTRDSATAKMIDQKTTWSTSFLAAASKKLWGTVCSNTPLNVGRVLANCVTAESLAVLTSTPTPGRATLTAIRPTASASVVTISK